MKFRPLFFSFHLSLTLLVPFAAIAADFTKSSTFPTLPSFTSAATAFHPAQTKSDLASLFTIREPGQPEDPKTGTPVPATAIASCTTLWSNATQALVFATAAPPTEATHSAIGILFLLTHQKNFWHIADTLRFTATGQDAGVFAQLTANVGPGYHLGEEGTPPVITIKESHGGRGYSYDLSASYTPTAAKLKRLELKGLHKR